MGSFGSWGMVIVGMLGMQEFPEQTLKQTQACIHIGQLWNGVMLFREFNDDFPKSLRDLVERPKDVKVWPEEGFLLGGKLPKDPWGGDYSYGVDGPEPRIWTWGADGKEGGEGENTDFSYEQVFRGRREERIEQCRMLIETLTQVCKDYHFDNNAYPPSGNTALVKAFSSPGPKRPLYFEFPKEMLNDKGEVIDAWGKPLVYRRNADSVSDNQKAHNKAAFDVYSHGPNGQDEGGGGDDIGNW